MLQSFKLGRVITIEIPLSMPEELEPLTARALTNYFTLQGVEDLSSLDIERGVHMPYHVRSFRGFNYYKEKKILAYPQPSALFW